MNVKATVYFMLDRVKSHEFNSLNNDQITDTFLENVCGRCDTKKRYVSEYRNYILPNRLF
jgi:hypothetical protein